MTATESYLAGLTDAQRLQLEAWLVEFDRSWTESRLAEGVRNLPPPGDPLRRAALLEMVKIDLERRWQRGKRVSLEAYLKSLPELGTAESVPADLVKAEYEVRRQHGDNADLASIARRFPRQAEQVAQLLRRSSKDQRAAGHDQPSTSDVPTTVVIPPVAAVGLAGELPEQLGRYRILKKLGQGGMGAVYLAHDSELNRQVALKVPRLATGDPQVLARFKAEALAAAAIQHPNVCPIYDVGEVDGVRYLIMAYVEGKPLSECLRVNKPLAQRQAAALVQKLALALHEAHARGVVHRDLKPGNIMLNARREPVIMDFGLARVVCAEGVRLTQSGTPLGTPAYMAPEQVEGDVAAMGPGCDVYSLGVILYELLTGRLPFEGTLAVVWHQVLSQEPTPPSRHRPDLDPRLEAICLRAMAKKPAVRFPSMAAFAAALEECRHGPPTSGATPVAPPRSSRPLPWLIAGAAAVLVGAVGLAGVLTLFHFAKPSPATTSTAGTRKDVQALKAFYFNQARAAFEVGDYDKAVAGYSEVIRLDPDDAEAYRQRGWAYIRKQEYDQAIADCTAALRCDHSDARSYHLRGSCYFQKQDYEHALLDFDAAIVRDPKLAEAYNGRGVVITRRGGDPDLAIKDFTAALTHDSNYAEAYYNRGLSYNDKGDFKKAVADFSAAVRLDPNHHEAFNSRGVSHDQMGQLDDALADYSKAIEINPRYTKALVNRGHLHMVRKDDNLAIADYTEAIRIDSKDASARHGRGDVYLLKGDVDQAIEDYSAAIGCDRTYFKAFNNRGKAYFAKEKYDEAIDDYTEAIRLSSQLAVLYDNRAEAYEKKNEVAKARADREEARKLKEK